MKTLKEKKKKGGKIENNNSWKGLVLFTLNKINNRGNR